MHINERFHVNIFEIVAKIYFSLWQVGIHRKKGNSKRNMNMEGDLKK